MNKSLLHHPRFVHSNINKLTHASIIETSRNFYSQKKKIQSSEWPNYFVYQGKGARSTRFYGYVHPSRDTIIIVFKSQIC